MHRSTMNDWCIFSQQGFKSQALAVTCDPEHKFELSVQLGDLKTAYTIAKELEVRVQFKDLWYTSLP